jgi:hypothetical protein
MRGVTSAKAWCTCDEPMSWVPVSAEVCSDALPSGAVSVIGAASPDPSQDQYNPAQRTGPVSGRSTVDDRRQGQNEPYPTAVL